MSDLTDKQIKFIVGLNKLTRETGVLIGGCGCCGSPFIYDASEDDLGDKSGYGFYDGRPDEGLNWISENDRRDRGQLEFVIRRSGG